jgi:hypothetical protein
MPHDFDFWQCIEFMLLSDKITDEVFGIDNQGRQLYNITTVWKLAGQDPLHKPDDFLRLETTKYAIIDKWQEDTKKTFRFDMEYYCKNTHKKRLEEEHESSYVKTTRGRYGSTYVDMDLLCSYVLHIESGSKQLLKDLLKKKREKTC